jgi:hypothetical protein
VDRLAFSAICRGRTSDLEREPYRVMQGDAAGPYALRRGSWLGSS